MRTIDEAPRKLEVIAEADVVVAGGGPGGLPAAVAAARNGAKTLLLERYGFLGGMATAGLIGPILGHTASESETPILGGIPRELCCRLHAAGGAPPWEQALKAWGVRFDPEIMKIVLDRMVSEAGVEILLHSLVTDAIVEDSRITALVIESKSGRQAVMGKVFVDGTGDADIAFRAGVPTQLGRPLDNRPMAMGTMFRLGGARAPTEEERKVGAERVAAARERGELPVYNTGVPGGNATMRSDQVTPNVTRWAGDPTDVRDLTEGELAVRRDTARIVQFYRENVPGFEETYLAAIPTQIGVRESRRVEGEYALSGEDVVAARKFEDVIALGSWWIDAHCPLGRILGNTHVCKRDCPADPPCEMLLEHRDELPAELYPPAGSWYDIPYRCLVPRRIDNLLVSGRCISATHFGAAAARVMGTCMAIGEAAGTAAALCVQGDTPPRELPVGELQDALRAAGAILNPE